MSDQEKNEEELNPANEEQNESSTEENSEAIPTPVNGQITDSVEEKTEEKNSAESVNEEAHEYDLTEEAMANIKALKDDELVHISINHEQYDAPIVAYVNALIVQRDLSRFVNEIKTQIEETERKNEEEFAEIKSKVNMGNEVSYEQGSDEEVHFIMELDQQGIQYHLETKEAEDKIINHFFFSDEDFEKALAISSEIETSDEEEQPNSSNEEKSSSSSDDKKGCMNTLLFLIALASALTWLAST